MAPPDKPYLTPKEVVALLLQQQIEVTDDTVRNWCTVGLENKKARQLRYKLTGHKVGGRWWIERRSLEVFIRLLSQSESDPPAPAARRR